MKSAHSWGKKGYLNRSQKIKPLCPDSPYPGASVHFMCLTEGVQTCYTSSVWPESWRRYSGGSKDPRVGSGINIRCAKSLPIVCLTRKLAGWAGPRSVRAARRVRGTKTRG